MNDEMVYGERGVLAYDALDDRVQCHGCGGWFQKLTSWHLRKHNLTIAEYKERYGLNASTALETPRLTALRRTYNARDNAAQHLVRYPKGCAPPAAGGRYTRRPEYLRSHHTPEKLRERAQALRQWSDVAMLAALRRLQEECGGYLRCSDLRKRQGQGYPSEAAVRARFGSWTAVCAALGQAPPQEGPAWRRGSVKEWSDDELVVWLRDLRASLGGQLTASYLRTHRSGGRQRLYPSYETVRARFGSWAAVLERLDAPE